MAKIAAMITRASRMVSLRKVHAFSCRRSSPDGGHRDSLHRRRPRVNVTLTGCLPSRKPRWSSLKLPLSMVVLVAVLGVATGAAAATVVFRDAGGTAPGVFTAEDPLYCNGLHELSPVQADPLLRDLGYEVTWQIEDRDARTSRQSSTPPGDGFIVEEH